MIQTRRTLAAAFAVAALSFVAPSAFAQRAAPVADAAAAPAGNYAIDPRHTAVIARVPHFGFSYSIFRFNTVAAELVWDPANPSANRLNATVQVASVDNHVDGFDEELQEERFLNTARFPTATFVSTAFRQIDASHGQVDGDFTLLGVTKRVTFDVTLIGAGQNQRGPLMGVTARTTINPADYGVTPMVSAPIEIVIDAEFNKRA